MRDMRRQRRDAVHRGSRAQRAAAALAQGAVSGVLGAETDVDPGRDSRRGPAKNVLARTQGDCGRPGAKLPDGVTVLSVSDSLCGYKGWAPKPLGPNASVTVKNDHRRAMNNVTRLSNMLDVLAFVCRDKGGVGFIGPKSTVEELERRWKKGGAGRPPQPHQRPFRSHTRSRQLPRRPVSRRLVAPGGSAERGGAARRCAVQSKGGGNSLLVRQGRPSRHARRRLPKALSANVIPTPPPRKCGRRSPTPRSIRPSGAPAPSCARVATAADHQGDGGSVAAAGGRRADAGERNPALFRDSMRSQREVSNLTFSKDKIKKGVLELLAMAFGLSRDAIRKRLKRTNSYREFPLAVCPPEALFGMSPPVDDTKSQMNGEKGGSSRTVWRVKAKAGDRYWTEVWLTGPMTGDEARRMLLRENIVVESIKPGAHSRKAGGGRQSFF